MKTLHGLPEDVIFCSKCLMSNQRPSTSPEFIKKNSKIKTAGFNKNGICDACRFNETKKLINWDERYKKLEKLCEKYRKSDGSYDVIVPGSGGKDSIFVSHFLKDRLGMNPLTVTWAPHEYTDIGLRNMRNWLSKGFGNITITPNSDIHRLLTKNAFMNLLNPFQPFIIGQKNVAPKIAMEYGIKFIMYGENQAEIHNEIDENQTSLMDCKHFTSKSLEGIYLAGKSLKEWQKENLNINSFDSYLPISKDKWLDFGGELHYMSYFLNWSPNNNYYYAKEHCDFEQNPNGRSEGTYTRFSSLDDKLDGQHYFTMFIKFGQGRAMNDANRDIRDGFITREEGLELVRKYDGEFPSEHFDWVLEYMQISESEYWDKINKARSPHLWKLNGDSWKLIKETK